MSDSKILTVHDDGSATVGEVTYAPEAAYLLSRQFAAAIKAGKFKQPVFHDREGRVVARITNKQIVFPGTGRNWEWPLDEADSARFTRFLWACLTSGLLQDREVKASEPTGFATPNPYTKFGI